MVVINIIHGILKRNVVLYKHWAMCIFKYVLKTKYKYVLIYSEKLPYSEE